MEEEKNLGTLPDALARRQRALFLSNGKTVVVEKFAISKTIYVFEYLAGLFKDLPREEIEQLKGNAYLIAAKALKLLGDKAPGLVRMCVRKSDEANLPEDPDADDALEIIATAVELNLTDKLVKKAAELKALFARLFVEKK